MFTNTLYRNLCASVTAFALALSVLAAFPTGSAHAQSTCSFTRDLYVGVSAGEDVRCLQRFLNASGFTIAASGVGSSGSETTIFGELTRQAAIRWQTAQGIGPATGTWGPASRGKYNALKGGTVVPATPASPSSQTTDEVRARAALSEAISAYQDAVDEVGADDDLVLDAADSLVAAFHAFLNRSYTQAITLANSARNDADDAIDDDSNDSNDDNDGDESDAEDAIEEAADRIDDAEEEIDDSNADDDDIEEAEDLVDEAKDLLDEAEEAFDDEDWEDAIDAAEDAIDAAEDAIDLVGGDSDADEEGARDAIGDVEEALDDAWDDFNDAEDDDEDTGDAEDLLDEAEETLEDANHAFDDEDWDEAVELAEEAMDLINDALDEF